MPKDKNGVIRVGELASYKLDDIQHAIKTEHRKRIPKKALLELAIDQLKTCAVCEKKLREFISNYKK